MATRIIYEGDEAVARSHLPRAQNVMHQVREFVAASGAGVYGQTLVLDDASYTYCLKAGDLESIYIFSQPDQEPHDIDHVELPVLPELYSGIVRDGLIRTEELPLRPGQDEPVKLRWLEWFKPNPATLKRNKDGHDPLREDYQPVKKLAVTPHPTYFSDFIGSFGSDERRREFSQYLNLKPSNYTGKMQKLVQVVLGFGRVPPHAVTEQDPKTKARYVNEGIQLDYDYRWHRSHGVVTAADDTLWLLEISSINGVIAMPLPVFPHSRQKLADSPHADYQAIVEEFNGLPSGYALPAGKRLTKAIAQGTVLRLATVAELTDFYRLQTFSTACGWAFDEHGSEAHNTAWEFGDDGMRRSYHYRIDIKLGGRTASQPHGSGSAKLVKVDEGRFFHGALKFPPPMKFYEPLLSGLLSVGFLPARPDPGNPDAYSRKIICDAPLFVYYADSQLKVVRYYYDRTVEDKSTDENNFEDCMYVGAWQQTLTSGEHAMPALFYTSDVDDRAQLPATQTVTNITGADVGFYTGFSDHPDDPEFSSYFRAKYFRMTGTIRFSEGMNIVNAVIVPAGLRNGIVYAVGRTTTASTTTKGVSYKSLLDPTSYLGFRVLFGVPPKDDCFVKGERKVREEQFSGGDSCALDFANEGSWAKRCDAIPEHQQGFDTTAPPATQTPPKPTESIKVTLYTGTDAGIITLGPVPEGGWSMYREQSPNEAGDVQFMDAMHSATLGPLQMYYATHLNPTGEQHASRGALMTDAVIAGNVNHTYNFLGVP